MSVFRQSANIVAADETLIGDYVGVVEGEVLTQHVSFINKGYASSISITSGADISAASFTIIGTFNNNSIIEVLEGPNTDTVSSVNLFHTITSIRASVDVGEAYSIGANNNVAVILNSYNTGNVNNFNLNNFNIMINSLTAAGDWNGASVIPYGLSVNYPSSLTTVNLTYGTRLNSFYSLVDLAAPVADVTQAELNRGFITTTNYPFKCIIVCFLNSVIDADSFVEITQS